MADIAVNFVIGKLSPFLVAELKLSQATRKEVIAIKSELEIIRAFLMDAESRAAAEKEGECEEGVKTWVKQVREEAYRIEDVIDEFSAIATQLPHGRGLVGMVHKLRRYIKRLKLNHEIGTEIQGIKSSLAEMQRRAQVYDFRYIDEGPIGAVHDSQVSSFFIDDAEVVGIESKRDYLTDLLVKGKSQRSVLVVAAEGGCGKITLAGKIHNNDAVKKHFDCQAWITVGKEYTKKDILKRIALEFVRLNPRQMDIMEEKELITMLREYLAEKCYMVVFDDVWKIEFWRDVEHALLDNNKGSRIMITTRNRSVAEFVPSSIVHLHVLEPLPPDKAWLLFCRKAFGSDECPQVLKELSQNIVEKCGGLPLAIVAVGGLMSTKYRIVSEWQKLLYGLGSKLGSDPHLKSCNRVLSEGYYNLPHHLKLCLLYFGLFPEGYSINCQRLIRLWLAEGFVPRSKYPPPEVVAEEYLNELINRNLVQVLCRDVSGRVRICRIHDLMHEILLRKVEELGFCAVMNGEDLHDCGKARRTSIHRSTNNVLDRVAGSKVRSVFLFNLNELPGTFVTTFLADFTLIKVLDFCDTPIKHLPEEVGDLFHLHYLSVRNTAVKILPKSIGKLLNLETLDLKNSLVDELPIEIKYLKKLRHLLAYHEDDSDFFYGRGTKVHEGLGSLTDLQKLCFVQADRRVLKELRKLRQLRRLGIKLISGNGKDVSACVENMNYLESLTVESMGVKDILDIESLTSPPLYLQRLYLRGNIKSLPQWVLKIKNLTRIGLDLFGLTEDPLIVLQALPNLVKLRLDENYHDELIFKEGCFPKLQELSLYNGSRRVKRRTMHKGVMKITIHEGAMPNLRSLTIGPCPVLLKEIPTGIDHLRNLQLLEFVDTVKETMFVMKNHNWEALNLHIPQILVYYWKAGKLLCEPIKHILSMSTEGMEHFIEELD